jgi:hypothetical protein
VAQDAIYPADGIETFLVKKIMNKRFKIESVGDNEDLKHFVGEEQELEILQKWAKGYE